MNSDGTNRSEGMKSEQEDLFGDGDEPMTAAEKEAMKLIMGWDSGPGANDDADPGANDDSPDNISSLNLIQ